MPTTTGGLRYPDATAKLSEFHTHVENLAKDVEAGTVWHLIGAAGEPAYQNAWQTWAAAGEVIRFRRDGANNLHIQGAVSHGTSGTTIFTLPAGYRPSRNVRCTAVGTTGANHLRVDAAGGVLADTAAGAGGWLALNLVISLR